MNRGRPARVENYGKHCGCGESSRRAGRLPRAIVPATAWGDGRMEKSTGPGLTDRTRLVKYALPAAARTAARVRAAPEMTSRLMPCQVSFDGLVVTAFMRSRPQPAPMNRVTTNHGTCLLKSDKALARSESGA